MKKESLIDILRRCKAQAKACIFAGGNWFSAVFVLIFLLITVLGIRYLVNVWDSILYSSGLALSQGTLRLKLFEVIFIFFLASPMVPGVYNYYVSLFYSFTQGASRGGIGELFSCYTSPHQLLRSYLLMLCVLWRVGLLLGITRLCNLLGEKYFSELAAFFDERFLGFLPFFRIILLFLPYLVWFAGIFLFIDCFDSFYISAVHPELSPAQVIRRSKQHMSGKRRAFFWLLCSFFGWFVLSYFSLGLLFLLYVLPYLIFTHISISSYLSTKYNGYLFSDNENETTKGRK